MESDHTAAIYQQRREQMDVNLNIVDVTRSYDSVTSPFESNDGSPSSSFDTGLKKDISSFEDDNSFLEEKDEENRIPSYERSPLEPYSGVGSLEEGFQSPKKSSAFQEPNAQREINSNLEPFRFFPMLILAQLFFLVGSAAFTWLSYSDEYMGGKHQVVGKNEIKYDISGEGKENGNVLLPEEGYHLKLSTSLDTWITHEMILALVAMFFILQAGIVNFVRLWQFFYVCQILAGLCGLVSAMFWQTKLLLSDVFFFLFCHAILLQAFLSLHMSYLDYIKPYLDALKQENLQKTNLPQRNPSLFISPRRKQYVESHFIFESSHDLSQNPSGLINASDDEKDIQNNSDNIDGLRPGNDRNEEIFSIENSYSYEESGVPATIPAPAPDIPTIPTQGPDEYFSNKEGKDVLSNRRKEGDVISKKFKYGIAFCVADSLFVLGSILESALTYLVVFVLAGDSSTSQADFQEDLGDSQRTLKTIYMALKIVPGILWGLYAAITLITAFTLQIRATKAQSK